MVEDVEESFVERDTGAENGCEHNFLIENRAFARSEGSDYLVHPVIQCLAYLIGHKFAYTLKVAAKAEHVVLNCHVAQFCHILADD